eukprot:1331609-Amorphochlora_amoeboformis.AAC.1
MASRVLSRRVFSSSHSASRIVPPAAHPNPGVSPSTSTVTSENKGRISSSLDSASVSVLEGVPNSEIITLSDKIRNQSEIFAFRGAKMGLKGGIFAV